MEQHERYLAKSSGGLFFFVMLLIFFAPEHWLVFVLAVAAAFGSIAYGYFRLRFVPHPNVIGAEKVKD